MLAVSHLVDYLLITGKLAGVLAGIVIALGAVAKSPLGKVTRWVYVRLAGEPVGEWFRTQVRQAAGDVVDQKLLTRNGGTTVPDISARLDRLAEKVAANHEQNVSNHIQNTARLDELAEQVRSLK